MTSCVYDCIHPLWGGGGTCHVSDDGRPVCSCDAGYASRDSRGNASCVPRRVLVSVYFFLGTASLLTAALTVWNINQYRHLPVRIQSARKTYIRLRVMVSTSVYLLGFVCIGYVLAAGAGDARYSDPAILLANYVVSTPALMFGISMMADYWVECLPSQVLAPGSLAGMLRKASETSSAFVLIGVANAAPISALGVLMVFFQAWPQMVADLAIGAGTTCAGAVVLFVASQTSAAITQAMAKGSASSRAFYAKAKSNLRLQAVTLCSIAFLGITVTMVKQLTLAGRWTPIIAWTAQMLSAHAGIVLFSLATRFETTSSARNSSTLAAPVDARSIRSPTVIQAISNAAAVAADALLLEQRRRLTIRPAQLHEHSKSGTKGVLHGQDTAECDAARLDVVINKSESSARNEAHRHYSWNAGTAKILPIHENPTVFDFDDEIGSIREEDWTIESAPDMEPPAIAG